MDNKKKQILAAAEKLFSQFGIKKTTMEDIAKKGRMGKSTLYYYFKSKEEVFGEVINKDSIKFKTELNNVIAKGETPQEKISNYVLMRMVHLKELSNYYSTLNDEYLEQYVFVEKIRKDFNDYEFNTLSNLLNGGVNKGIFSSIDIDITARNILICLKGLEYIFFTKNINVDIKEESDQMLHMLFKGIEFR